MCFAGGGGVGLGENPEPGGAGGSARQPEPEAPGIAGRSSLPRPAPRRTALRGAAGRPPGWVAPLSHSRLRRCPPERREGAGARGAARGRAGLGARQGEGAWRSAPSSPRSAERAALARSLSERGDRRRPPLLASLPRAQTPGPSSASPPTVGVGQRRGEPEGEGGWAAEEQEKKLFPPAPRAWSLARVSPRGGWELHLRPGARGQGWTLGSRGEGCGVTCTGVAFAIGLPAASGQGGAGATGAPGPVSHQTVAGRSAACSCCGGCDPGRGPRQRAPPAATPLKTHTHTLCRPSCHRSPQAWGGGAESPLRGGRRRVNPPQLPGSQGSRRRPGDRQPRERARRLRPGRRRCWGRAGGRPRPPLRDLAPPPRLLLPGNNTTALLLYPPSVGRLPGVSSSPSLPPIC